MLENGMKPQYLLSLLSALAANGAALTFTDIYESPKKSPRLSGAIPGVLPISHQSKTLQLVASPSLTGCTSITVYPNSTSKAHPWIPSI